MLVLWRTRAPEKEFCLQKWQRETGRGPVGTAQAERWWWGGLLPVPMAGVTHNWEPRRRKAKVFSSLTQEKELSCNAKIGGIAMKVLIDR